MARPHGVCRLCRLPSLLEQSHLIPAAIYRILRGSGEKPDPTSVTTRLAIQSSRQIRDYLLCADCEGRFNVGGEGWVMKHCTRSENESRIHDALRGARQTSATTATVEGIDQRRLAYFGASVFWRASAHTWKSVNKADALRIALGPYEEELRSFLLAEHAFPTNAALLVNVMVDPLLLKMLALPGLMRHNNVFRVFRFLIPGFTFRLFTGRAIPPEIRSACVVRGEGRPIHTSPAFDRAKEWLSYVWIDPI